MVYYNEVIQLYVRLFRMLLNRVSLCCAVANSIQTLPVWAGDFAVFSSITSCLWLLCITSSTEYRNLGEVRRSNNKVCYLRKEEERVEVKILKKNCWGEYFARRKNLERE